MSACVRLTCWTNIFPKNHLKNVPCANIRNCFWLGVVIELISSNWKVIATCVDSYIKDIFFSCKRVINHRSRLIIGPDEEILRKS